MTEARDVFAAFVALLGEALDDHENMVEHHRCCWT